VTSYGAFGYWIGYGKCNIVTDCLPPSPVTTVIKIALCVSLILTHPIILYPASQILENFLFRKQSRHLTLKRYSVRAAEVVLTCTIGLILPNFPIFSDFVGSILLTLIGFIIPPLLYIKLQSGKIGIIPIGFNGLIITLGFAFMFIGTYSSVQEIIKVYA